MHRGTLWRESPPGHVGDSNPQSDDSNIDEGWDDEPGPAALAGAPRCRPGTGALRPNRPRRHLHRGPPDRALRARPPRTPGAGSGTTRPPAIGGPRSPGAAACRAAAAPATSPTRSAEASRLPGRAGPIEPKKEGDTRPPNRRNSVEGEISARGHRQKASKKALPGRRRHGQKTAIGGPARGSGTVTKGHDPDTKLASTNARRRAERAPGEPEGGRRVSKPATRRKSLPPLGRVPSGVRALRPRCSFRGGGAGARGADGS